MSQPAVPTIDPPHPDPSRPAFVPPTGACDSHCHVFGPHHRFPYAAGRTFTPHDVSVHDLRDRHRLLGLDRAVIVQSACHGRDHSALLDALAAGGGRYRGVALLGPDASHDEVAGLHAAGVRGVRLQFMPHLGSTPSEEQVRRTAELVEPFGWHVAVHVAGNGILDHLTTFRSLPGTLVIDHLARLRLDDGYPADAVDALRRLFDQGNVWVKISGLDRVSVTGPPYDDAVTLAAEVAAHAPERVVWGSDFPHPNVRGPVPDDGALVDLVPRIVPDEQRRHQMLVENPAALFGFEDR